MKSIAFLTARHRISHKASLVSLASIMLLSGSNFASADCYYDTIRPSTWQTRFANNGDGTVTDKATGLQWKRCAEGQIWDGTTCTGSATTFSWEAALQRANQASLGGYDDWRLPNIKELYSIVEVACNNPSINTLIFQRSPSGRFWSSSYNYDEYARFSAWLVDFDAGVVGTGGYMERIRLVRSVE